MIQWSMTFQRGQGKAGLPHPGFHVRPGSEATFGNDVGHAVQNGIKDLESQVGHAHFIGVGKCQSEGKLATLMVLMDRINLTADITAGFLDGQKEGFEIHISGSEEISRY